MALRIEVMADGAIEIMRPLPGRSHFMHFPNIETAMRVIRFLIKQDLQRARNERFVPQIEKEAKTAFKQMSERSPYNAKR